MKNLLPAVGLSALLLSTSLGAQDSLKDKDTVHPDLQGAITKIIELTTKHLCLNSDKDITNDKKVFHNIKGGLEVEYKEGPGMYNANRLIGDEYIKEKYNLLTKELSYEMNKIHLKIKLDIYNSMKEKNCKLPYGAEAFGIGYDKKGQN